MTDSPRHPIAQPDAPEDLRTVAEQVAAEAAVFVRSRRAEVFGSAPAHDQVRTKSTPTDPVTVVDTETEALLRRRLAQLRPGDAVLGEEGGGPSTAAAAGSVTWVLDPIDGTVNFVYGLPAYAVSVAAQVDGRSVAGAVAAVASGEIYSAAIGSGARVRTDEGVRTLRCSAVTDLRLALVGTGFAYSASRRRAQAQLLAGLLPRVRDIRRFGSAALDLCLVAAGQLDAHYEHGLQVWDWAAGALIAAEAGAAVRLPAPDEPGALAVAAAPAVLPDLMAALAELGGTAAMPS